MQEAARHDILFHTAMGVLEPLMRLLIAWRAGLE